tara:strand:- start:794 stop:1138 length:345 start_codon:yes stop_codon:yes gene_type:complete
VESAIVGGKASRSLVGRVLAFAGQKVALAVFDKKNINYRFDLKVQMTSELHRIEIRNGPTIVIRGIFRFEGEKLRLCFVRGKVTPPKQFEAKGRGHTAYLLKKVQDKPDQESNE